MTAIVFADVLLRPKFLPALPWPICEVCEHARAVGESDDGTPLCGPCADAGVADSIIAAFMPWAAGLPYVVEHAIDNPFSEADGACAICGEVVGTPKFPGLHARDVLEFSLGSIVGKDGGR